MTKYQWCNVCDGTGWVTYAHPDENGPTGSLVVGICGACVADWVCPKCGDRLMEWGAVQLCAGCGLLFDEAAEPAPSQR